MTARHSIQRAALEVTAHGVRDGLRLQNQVADFARTRLLPEIEGILDSLAIGEQQICIERIEIEVDASDLDTAAPAVFARLKTVLGEQLARAQTGADAPALPRRESLERWFFRMLSYFLRHGRLAWSWRSDLDLERELDRWVGTCAPPQFQDEVVTLLSAAAARWRLVQSFPAPAVERFISVFGGVPAGDWISWHAEERRLAASLGESLREEHREQLWRLAVLRLIESLATNGFRFEPLPFREWVSQIYREWVDVSASGSAVAAASFTSAFVRKRARLGPNLANRSALEPAFAATPSAAGSAEDGQTRSHAPTAASRAHAKDPEGSATSAPHVVPDGEPRAASRGPRSHGERAVTRVTREELEGCYARHAGLVLIAPFLPALFERAALYVHGQLTSPETALLVLHFLATGREAAREHELVMGKILCAWDLEEPVALPERLPEPAKAQALRLLASVIEHWSLLKSTSLDGLREAFLQRPGKVARNEQDQWVVQVEQRSYDLLLDQLPWNISFIKLPWMQAPLRTEWR